MTKMRCGRHYTLLASLQLVLPFPYMTKNDKAPQHVLEGLSL